MGIQTALVQYILYGQMMMSLLLLQPYCMGLKAWFVRSYIHFMKTTVLKHIFLGMYGMVALMFFDSAYHWNISDSAVLVHQSEKNFYLSGFALFLALLFNKLCGALEETFRTHRINEDNVKQKGNSMAFVSSVIQDAKDEKERNQKMQDEIKSLKEEVDKNKNLVSEIENSRQAYLKLKDKYEILRKERHIESRKNK
jgi:hypothetical protein